MNNTVSDTQSVGQAISNPMLTITSQARDLVVSARLGEPQDPALALWLEAHVLPSGKFSYELYFQPRSEIALGDAVVEIPEASSELAVIIESKSVERLRGATLDVSNGGLVLSNPNEAPEPSLIAPGATPSGSLEGPVAQKVINVLETHVNPSIASHGGFATLVSVDGDKAFITMGGGCQGCAMSKATLSQGIEVAIKQYVPEIAYVIDVTDHQSGANPYHAS